MALVRIVTEQTLAARLRAIPLPELGPPPRVVVSGNLATPYRLIAILDEVLERYVVHALNAHDAVDAEHPERKFPNREGAVLETTFVGPAMRRSPQLRYLPCRLSLVPTLYSGALPVDVVIVHTSAPRDGTVSLGIECNVLPAAIAACRDRGGLIVAALNSHMPYTYGDAVLDTSDIDLAVEMDEPLPEFQRVVVDDLSRQIGDRVAHLVADGSTLQLGIGGIPDAVLSALPHRRGLRVWTEMFSDGILALERAGALDVDHPVNTSFMFGSNELYRWVDKNPRVRLLRTEVTNDPGRISRNPLLVSVNSALEVDLFAQANASRVNGRIYSGFGGQTDFIVGALHSRGGQAFIALRSWHPKADCSTIVPLLDEPVTSFQHSAIITEQGVAPIHGRSQGEQARALIAHAAHPDVREELIEEAHALGLL